MWYDSLIEQNKLPDFILRTGVRLLLKQHLRHETAGDAEVQQHRFNDLLEELKGAPIAVHPDTAQEQPAELPAEFYQFFLGKHLKFSSAYWRPGVTDIDTADEDMLELTCQRADLQNGQDVLELGSGWGSLSLFMAAKYPASSFISVSTSAIQKAHIDKTAKDRNITNLTVVTADMNTFQILQQFDRVVSVELFDQMRNYKLLLNKISGFLKEKGKLFVHVFTHETLAYQLDAKEEGYWMNRYFLKGGIMPSNHLLTYFNEDLKVDKLWVINGTNYSKTAEAWLENMDKHEQEITAILEKTYGKDQVVKYRALWRLFFIICAELFSYRKGNAWMVCQYLFRRTA
jgi:cyclopropane-fatty-acyl-phospholipid synthase